MPTDKEHDNTERNELYDVIVETMGLVTRGANREPFFLLKSDPGVPDGSTQPVESPQGQTQGEQEVERSLWQRFTTTLRGVIKQEVTAQLPTTENTAQPSPTADTVPVSPVEVTEKANEVAVTGQQPSEPLSGSSTPDTLEVTEQPPVASGLSKQETIMADETTLDVTKAAERIADLETRLAKAEQEAAFEKESRERSVYLAKAQSLPAFPIPATELADHMYWLSKTDAKRAAWFESLMTATNSILKDSELFAERGTSRTTTESTVLEQAEAKVRKGEATDMAAALLSMNKTEAALYVAKRQAETRAR
jgi:hypothetical protein